MEQRTYCTNEKEKFTKRAPLTGRDHVGHTTGHPGPLEDLSIFDNASNEFDLKWGEWLSGFHSFRQVTEVNLGQVRSDSGWVTLGPDLTTHLVVLWMGH